MWICIKIQNQVIWLAENQKWTWHLNLFSRTRVKINTVAPDKALFFFNPKVLIFSLFLYENLYCGFLNKCLIKALPMSTYNICFHGEIKKIFIRYAFLSGAMSSTGKPMLWEPIINALATPQKHTCGLSLEPPSIGASNDTHKICFQEKNWNYKIQNCKGNILKVSFFFFL